MAVHKKTALFLIVSLIAVFVLPLSYGGLYDSSLADAGFSGYITSYSQLDYIIAEMESQNLTVYRMSFNPEWFGSKPHPYNSNFIQYFLDNSNFSVIVDRNHLYPPTETSASEARSNWATVNSSIFEVLASWENNTRVAVELINEYVSGDFYTRMQGLVYDIRDSAYNNTIIVNKWSQSWGVLYDDLNQTYQGYHYYFNYWSPSGAQNNMQQALNLGIKLINTEVGAHSNERLYFTTSLVNELQTFLEWSYDNGVGNCIWMYENVGNLASYYVFGLNFEFILNFPVYPPEDGEEPDPELPPEDIEEEPEVIEETEDADVIIPTITQSGTRVSGGGIKFLVLNGSAFAITSDVAGIIINVSSGDLNGTLNSLVVYPERGSFLVNCDENANFTVQGWTNTDKQVLPSISGTTQANREVTKTLISAYATSGDTVRFSWGISFEPLLPIMFILGMCGIASFFGGFVYAAYKIKEGEYSEGLYKGLFFCSIGFGLIWGWLAL